MDHGYITDNCKISSAITPTAGAAGVSDINGSILDMAGFEGVKMHVRFGAITAGAVTSIKAQQGSQSDLSDAADIAGSGQTVADTDDDKSFVIDLLRPDKRYVRLVVDRGTQNAVVAEAHYEQYGAFAKKITHGSDVAVEQFTSPAEGAA
jgi:hypothetical protein